MVNGVLRGGRLRFERFGGALVAVTGLLAGCEDSSVGGAGDGGADAATGFASADPRGTDAGDTGIDTQDLSVGIDTREAVDTLSVGLGTLGGDAGDDASVAPVSSSAEQSTNTSAPDTSAPDTSAPTIGSGSASTAAVGSSGDTPTSEPPSETSDAQETSASPVDTSSAPSAVTSAPVVSSSDVASETVDTSGAPTSESVTTEAVTSDSTSPADTSAPPIVWDVGIAADASWVDLPATFRALGLPDINLTLSWSVLATPEGSEVSDVSLSNASSSQVTFVPDVAGDYTLRLHLQAQEGSVDVDATVTVAMVDVGFLELTEGPDGAYAHEPMMVPSDQTLEPFNVGCSFESWDFGDFRPWLQGVSEETKAIGFDYPTVPAEQTAFAYHFRDNLRDSGYTHVATAESDCANNRPVDLTAGAFPDFSPSGKELSRVDYVDSALIVSPIDANSVSYLDAWTPWTTDWWSETSVVWAADQGGEPPSPVIGASPVDGSDYSPILDCLNARQPALDGFDKVAVVDGGLMVLSSRALWFIPVTIDATGNYQASCEYGADGNVSVGYDVVDFEVAPDGRTLAFISQVQSDSYYAYLAVGPAAVPFDFYDDRWMAHELASPGIYYTGLHWIADSAQLVWTEIQYAVEESDGYYYTYIYDSAVRKLNADGSYPRTLAYHVQPQYPRGVITTGPIEVFYGFLSGGF